jgi:hypothetical protein
MLEAAAAYHQLSLRLGIRNSPAGRSSRSQACLGPHDELTAGVQARQGPAFGEVAATSAGCPKVHISLTPMALRPPRQRVSRGPSSIEDAASLWHPSTCWRSRARRPARQRSAPQPSGGDHAGARPGRLGSRLLGTAILTEGGVQAARLSARPILRGSQACQASRRILDRYRRCGPREAEQSSFRVIAAACSRYGFTLVDHIVVVASGD